MLAKADLVTYSGPHYSTFGMKLYFDYVLNYFKRCLMTDEPFEVQPSDEWTDDAWYMNQDDRKPKKNEGWWVINKGQACGSIQGGNLCTFNLLQGTEYMPSLKDTILFVEDDAEVLPHHFDRDMVSLIQQPGFEGVRGIVIGRFQQKSKMSRELLTELIRSKKELKHIPIIANVDFGHTNQLITYPIGGKAEIKISEDSKIVIIKH
jgi:muramoyltetrapeptide carboxypeptidase